MVVTLDVENQDNKSLEQKHLLGRNGVDGFVACGNCGGNWLHMIMVGGMIKL